MSSVRPSSVQPSSVQPHYVRPKKLNNNVKMVFKPEEIVVTAKNVQSRAQKRLSDRHHQVDAENNTVPNQPRQIRSQPQNQQRTLRSLPQNQVRIPQHPVRTLPQAENENTMRYELMPGVKNLHVLQQQQDQGHQPRTRQDQGRQPQTRQDNGHQPQLRQDHGRQPQTRQDHGRQPQKNPGYKSVTDRLHQSREQDLVRKPGSGRLDHLLTGRQPALDSGNLEQAPALQQQFQVNDEYDERPRRRHPAGSSFIRVQDSPEPITGYQRSGYTVAGGANTVNQRPGFSGGAQSRLSKDRTSVSKTVEADCISTNQGLSYQPQKPQTTVTGRPLVSGNNTTPTSAHLTGEGRRQYTGKDRIHEAPVHQKSVPGFNLNNSGDGEHLNQNWYKKPSSYNNGQLNIHAEEEDEYNIPKKYAGDLRAKLNKMRNIPGDLDPEMERFQSLKIQDNDAVNNNQIAFKPLQDPKNCICMRKLKIIFCQGCLHSEFGRISKQCDQHPEDQYLMDTTSCGSCRKSDLKEYDIPANIDVSNIMNKLASKK